MRGKMTPGLIAAVSLILFGCILFVGVMTRLEWDFTALSTAQYETNRYDIRESFNSISILTDTADIALVPSADGKVSVVCYEQENVKHAVTVKDDTLVIEATDTRKWHEHIGIQFGTPTITVSVPQGDYGTICVKTSTGDIRVQTVSADTVDLSVSTGDVTISDLRCKTILSGGSTGDMFLKNVIATETISIERNTGDVLFDSCDAAEILVKTDTGDVKGGLLSDKVFIAHTDTGRVDVPKTAAGGRCEITTDTGDIVIAIR